MCISVWFNEPLLNIGENRVNYFATHKIHQFTTCKITLKCVLKYKTPNIKRGANDYLLKSSHNPISHQLFLLPVVYQNLPSFANAVVIVKKYFELAQLVVAK